MLPVTTFYASLLALWFVWLSLNVIKLRRRFQIRLGDGSNNELQAAISAQSNAAQYIPFALLLIALLEINQAHLLFLHLLGLMLLSGRIVHARGILKDQIPLRVKGMQLTLFTLVGSSVLNLLYLIV